MTGPTPFPANQVAWGFPGAGGGFGDDGALRGALLPMVFFGTLGRPPTERERAVREAFRQAGFRFREQPDFRGWLWIHFVQNAGLHTQSLKLGSLGKLAGAPGNVREAVLATRELLPLVEARGVDLGRHRGDVLPVRAPAWLTAPTLAWLLGHFPPVRLLLEAHANPEELRAVCRDTLAEARRLGVAVPRLEAAEPYFLGEAATHLDPPPQDPARTETPQASRTDTPQPAAGARGVSRCLSALDAGLRHALYQPALKEQEHQDERQDGYRRRDEQLVDVDGLRGQERGDRDLHRPGPAVLPDHQRPEE